jgi:hypothetical protein
LVPSAIAFGREIVSFIIHPPNNRSLKILDRAILKIEEVFGKRNGANAVFCLGEYPIFQIHIFSRIKAHENRRVNIDRGGARKEEKPFIRCWR